MFEVPPVASVRRRSRLFVVFQVKVAVSGMMMISTSVTVTVTVTVAGTGSFLG